ncbi:MAG: endonuclease domain-containing protein [Bacteroidetes bacterium]|nr:endonuclease domain-containing protein [Bacteroidota bacterium]
MENELHFGAKPEIFRRAQDLRKELTPAEKLLWRNLRGRRFMGLKFRRQHPVSHFIADFYCHEKKLVIEIDGGIHNLPEVKERDEGRTEELIDLGLIVIRFTNEEIEKDMVGVLKKLKSVLTPALS